MSQQQPVDPLTRVVECERAILTGTDPEQQAELSILRDIWLALAVQIPYLSNSQLAEEIAAIEKVHAVVFGPWGSAVH